MEMHRWPITWFGICEKEGNIHVAKLMAFKDMSGFTNSNIG
jgi:hypothetical protein